MAMAKEAQIGSAFSPGETVYISTGCSVTEARIERRQSGRYIVSYGGLGLRTRGHICISGGRLFRTRDEAVAHVKAIRAGELAQTSATPARRETELRVDAPGDGWAQR